MQSFWRSISPSRRSTSSAGFPGAGRDELLTAMQAMQKREQSMLDALRWAAVDAGRDKLVTIVQAMQIREESLLEILKQHHGLLGTHT